MATTRQSSFRAGEWAPSMWGRTDLAGYSHALRRARNFIITPQGTAASRPGTRYVADCKTHGSKVRLVPFAYSDTDSMVLEFGDKYVRFHRNGQPVLKGGVPYERATPYSAGGLWALKFIQVGSVLTLVHPLHEPRELVRQDESNWTLRVIDFTTPAHGFTGSLVPVMYDPPAQDSQQAPGREWQYRITEVRRIGGVLRESKPYTVVHKVEGLPVFAPGTGLPIGRVALGKKLVIYPETKPVKLWIPVPSPPAEYLRVYRGRGQTFGFVGEVKVTSPRDTQIGMYFEDRGMEPDYGRPPPAGRVPFQPGNFPSVVGMFEQRLLLGNFLLDEPGTVRASATDSFRDFDRRIEDQHAALDASASLEFDLASRRAEEVRALIGLDRLLVLTQSSVWSVEGADGRPLSPSDLITARVQSEVGASWLDPIAIGNRILWVRAKGQGVRDLVYDWAQRSYVGSDLSLAVPHLLRSPIVDWAYAEDPFNVAWMVRADGKLLSLTYGEGGAAWAQHDTPGGVVESVCCVPEGDEDAVYLVVKRANRRFVERMASRRTTDVREAMRLDCGRTQVDGGPLSRPSTVTVTGLDHLNGYDVHAVCDGRVSGPHRVTGGEVTIPVPPKAPTQTLLGPVTTHVGLRFDAELELLDVPVAREKNKKVSRVLWEIEGSSGLWTGEAWDRLVEWRQRTVGAGFGPNELVTGEAEVLLTSTWNRHGRAVLRQVDPLPVTVLGVTREGEFGS